MNNEWERIWKEGVTACFNVLSTHLPGGIEENPYTKKKKKKLKS
jgi:hypothetical protein